MYQRSSLHPPATELPVKGNLAVHLLKRATLCHYNKLEFTISMIMILKMTHKPHVQTRFHANKLKWHLPKPQKQYPKMFRWINFL